LGVEIGGFHIFSGEMIALDRNYQVRQILSNEYNLLMIAIVDVNGC
jgi:hypothetical protein